MQEHAAARRAPSRDAVAAWTGSLSPLLNAVQTSCTTTDYCTWAELRFSGSRLHAMDDGKLSSASRCYILAFAASAMMLGRAPPNDIASRRFAAALNGTPFMGKRRETARAVLERRPSFELQWPDSDILRLTTHCGKLSAVPAVRGNTLDIRFFLDVLRFILLICPKCRADGTLNVRRGVRFSPKA